MVLLDDVVTYLFGDLDRCLPLGVERFERGLIGVALVDGIVSGSPFLSICFSK